MTKVMEHAKKMVLVDPRLLESQQQQQMAGGGTTTYTQPESVVIDMTVRGLDQGLEKFLNAPNIPQDQKAKLYSHYLQQYLTMKKKQTQVYRDAATLKAQPQVVQPVQIVQPAQAPQPIQLPQNAEIQQEIVASVPKNLQKQAKLLIERVKRHPNVGWNQRGELLIQGQKVANSNMVDLVKDLLKKRKNVNPPGWKELATELRESNVPLEYIRNPDRLAFISQHPAPTATSLSESVIQSAIEDLNKEQGTGRGKGRG